MSSSREDTITTKDIRMNGALYINDQLVSDKCSLTASFFEIDTSACSSRHEQVLVGESSKDAAHD